MENKTSTLVFFLNGKKVVDPSVDPELTLLTYLRRKCRLPGTKVGCSEGGCGACTVMVSRFNRKEKKIEHLSVNACLAPVTSVHGQAVTTVEGIGSTRTKLHPVQERIAKAHGSQCGFCTPGIVMSMYTLLRNNQTPSLEDLDTAFQGNLCRCTGYRPILEGYKTFTKEFCCGGNQTNGCCRNGYEDDDIGTDIFQINDFTPYDPSQDLIFPSELQLSDALDSKSLVFTGKRVTWYHPSKLAELLKLKQDYPTAKIVVGNSEVGIEMKFKNQLYPVIIYPSLVSELNFVQHLKTGIRFGAATTLTNLDKVLREAIEQMPESKTRVFSAIVDMLHWFAGHQIRNVACIGGNIATGSPISDLNPIFMAAKCTLDLISTEGKRSVIMDDGFFLGYRKTILHPTEIILSIHIPFTSQDEYFFGYKQAHRRDDDISIVNAAMRVLFHSQSNKIQELSLVYGGMAPITVMAKRTMKELQDRSWDDKLLSDACQYLADDLPLPPGVPGGMESYRQTLTTGFFFRFYLNVQMRLVEAGLSQVKVPSTYESACNMIHRDFPKSTQFFEIVPSGQLDEDPVGRPKVHQTGYQQATGEAVYCDDIPLREDELYLALVTSTKAHAKLVNVDPQPALDMPGVHGYVSYKDIPGTNLFGPNRDEELFATEEVSCIGHVIAAVVAKDQAVAQRAAKAVKIEYEELPIIITIEEAIAAQSYLGPPIKAEGGDIEAGFAAAHYTLEGEMKVGGQEHFYLETQSTIAIPKGESNEFEVIVSAQNVTESQENISRALNIPANRIVAKVKRIGGGFGGKETRSILVTVPCAIAANKYQCPVRCILDRDEDMIISGTRHPYKAQYKVGFTKHRLITALDIRLYSNGGNTLDLSVAVLQRAVFGVLASYNIPNIRIIAYACKTNTASNTAFRGFGAPQGMLFTETFVNDIAKTLGLAPTVVRERNFSKSGDVTFFGQPVENCTIQQCWDQCLVSSEYERRKEEVDLFNRENRWKKRGIAVIPVMFGIAFTISYMNQSGALVHIYLDGSVLISHGGMEMGQGLHTKVIQVASRALHIPDSYIHIQETSTDKIPNASATAASTGSDLNCSAVLNACQILLERLEPFMRENPKGKWKDWVNAAYMGKVSLSAAGYYYTPLVHFDINTQKGRPYNYYTNGVACSEVEIDCLTGDHQPLRTDIVMDVGSSLNPALDIGQIEGAFIQGYGMFVLEEQRWSPNGFLFTQGPGTYKIPGFTDIPMEFNVSLLKGAPNPRAVYSSKAIGEPPLFLASSIYFAIKEAVESARKDFGVEGIFRFDSPATAERIRMACIDRFTEQFPQPEPGTYTPWHVNG